MSKARNLSALLDNNGKVEAGDLDVGQLGGRRNLIINGAMQVWQRGTSWTNYGGYVADRWFVGNPGTTSISKVTTPFGDALSYTRSQGWGLWQRIEWQNVSWLKAGDKLTLQYVTNGNSFGDSQLQNGAWGATVYADSTETVSLGSGWYQRVETFVVTQALIDACSAAGFLHLGVEPDSSTGEFTITRIQLELGDTATPFEHRSYGEELVLCQRYFGRYGSQYHYQPQQGSIHHFNLPVNMRAKPTVTMSSAPTGLAVNRTRTQFVTFTNIQANGDINFYADAEL